MDKKRELKGKIGQNLPEKLPVVGIGASAGGLDALKKMFSNLPSVTGMAFVLVQHLDPTHESALVDLMGKYAQIKVVQVEDGMILKPDQLYIIPPNKDMGMINGKLQLMDPVGVHGLRLPINYFFKNLAEDQAENSICIILSGFGTDGTLGLKAIKAEGGMVIAQDPHTAASEGMPQSAIKTGMVDFVLPPEEIPAKLIDYVNSSKITLKKIVTPEEENINAMNKIFMHIRNRKGHDFSLYKESTVNRRIARRINIHQMEKLSEYLLYLRENPHEIDILFQELLINVTNFFRDKNAFDSLKNALKKLVEEKSDYDNIRVWVPGCSTGEEVYSIAIIIHELMEELGKVLEVQIFGTDIDPDAIKIARSGTYQNHVSEDITSERLKKYFIQKDNLYVIKNEIREMAVFAPHDVLKDPPFTKIDILSCRNLLIYLKSDAQQKVLSNFNYSLNNDGILFLGPSENVGEFIDAFAVADKKWKIFRCVKSTNFVRKYVTEHPLPNRLPLSYDIDFKFEDENGMSVSNISRLAENELLKTYAPPSAIITDLGEILYIHGRLGNYLEPSPGRAKLNILDMAREGLEFDLNSTIQSAVSRKEKAVAEGIRVKNNGGFKLINLTVKPIMGPESAEKLLIVSFEDLESNNVEKNNKLELEIISNGDKNIKKLENELKLTKERLDITIEEMKTSNEELKSANEELQSMNEESQSTNEELETSKEELQSINEELSTVNTELQMKIDDLSTINDDMENLFNSTEIATIFLDKDLNIRRFTPESSKIVKIIDSDIGRPLSDIVSNLKYDKMVDDIKEVITRVVFKEKELQAVNGNWYFMRIMPYKTAQDFIDGAVLTFIDITYRKKIYENLQEALNYAESIINTVRGPLVVLDDEIRVISANKSFFKTFKITPGEAEGKELFKLGKGEWDVPKLREILEKILPAKEELQDFEIEIPQIQSNKIILNARQVYRGEKGQKMILMAMDHIE